MTNANRDTVVSQILRDYGFQLEAVRVLHEQTQAGWATSCERIAPYAPSDGLFIFLDKPDGHVLRIVPIGGFGRGIQVHSDQSSSHIYRVARSDRNGLQYIVSNDTQFRYSNGSTPKLYAQATWVGNMLVVLALTENAPWLPAGSSPKQRGTSTFYRDKVCDKCGGAAYPLYEWKRCNSCGERRCPRGHCRCSDERLCKGCDRYMPVARFKPGSEICEECAE